MKKLLCSVFLALLLISAVSATAQAVQVTIDLDKLPADQAAKVIEAQKQADNPAPKIPTSQTVREWTGLGKEIGTVIAETCKELSIGVNEFVRTPVGRITMYLIVWKVVGKELWHIVGGIGVWVLVTSILVWSLRFFHMPARVKDKTTGKVQYVERFKFDSGEAKGLSAAVHVFIFVVITIACMAIVFS